MRSLLILILVPVLPLVLDGPAPRFCSLGYGGSQADDAVFFVGTPLSDTVKAGLGSTTPSGEAGHYGFVTAREVFGQLIEVERLAGPGQAEIVQAPRRAVVVPWDYDAGCEPTLWTKSADFLATGERVFVAARLRAQEHWVGDVPTFDAFHPHLDVYPLRLFSRFDLAPGAHPPDESTVLDMFEVHQRLPTRSALESSRGAAVAELVGWARADSARASLYPVSRIVAQAVRLGDRVRSRTVQSPVRGTYALRVILPSGAEHAVFLRTSEHASSPWYEGQTRPWLPETTHLPWESAVVGIRYSIWSARHPQDLPDSAAGVTASRLSVTEQPVPSDGGLTWRGHLDVRVLRAAQPAGPEFDLMLEALTEQARARILEPDPDWQNVIFEETDGSVSLRLEVAIEGFGRLEVIGRRITEETVVGVN